jgi:hypothetical protein
MDRARCSPKEPRRHVFLTDSGGFELLDETS